MSQNQIVRGVATHLCNNTPDNTQVWYHNTCVVEFNPERIRLYAGRWKTATTKLRMNQASNQFMLGYHVYQEKHGWYVRLADGTVIDFSGDEVIIPRDAA